MNKKEIWTLIILFAAVAMIIFAIEYVQGNGNHDKETIKCIASKSKLIVLPTCSACAAQKQILGDYVDEFELITLTQEVAEQYQTTRVPTWVIDGKNYVGVYTIEQLKEITGC